MDISKYLMPSALLAIGALLIGVGFEPGGDLEGAALMAAPEPERLFVPPGQILNMSAVLDAAHLDVQGTLILHADDNIHLDVGTLIVGPAGILTVAPATTPEPVVGANASAEAGRDGVDLWIQADKLVVAPGGIIEGAAGAVGQAVYGMGNVTAGNGGNGGDVNILASDADVQGTVAPGRGGDGGDARSVAPSGSAYTATAGDGGSSGAATMNGQPTQTSKARGYHLPRLVLNLDQVAEKLRNMDLPDGVELPGDLKCGPYGADGRDNLMGRGGDGGNACSDANGASGGQGTHGYANAWGCTPGGQGGPGQAAVAGTAVAGNGGLGSTGGGDGGFASAFAFAGGGGAGGNGGRYGLHHCAGGDGGPGGDATGGSAYGGNGGTGLCGPGGHGGDGNADADAGPGGYGGTGNPGGSFGANGIGYPGIVRAGQGGTGSDTCDS